MPVIWTENSRNIDSAFIVIGNSESIIVSYVELLIKAVRTDVVTCREIVEVLAIVN